MCKLSFIFLICLLLSGWMQAQEQNLIDRKQEIEKVMEKISSIKQFKYVAKELEMTIDELADYPVIFPIKREDYRHYTSSAYGMRLHPIYHVVKNHTGIDIAEPKGSPVYTTGNGVVVDLGWKSGYGNFVEVKHAGGFTSFYAHLDKTVVSIGDSVAMGEQIACVGNSGVSTGSHLHYEVRKNGKFLNAEEWCWGWVEIVE